MEESMKEAAKMLNEPPVSGRTLEATEDPEGEDARRAGRKAGSLGSSVCAANLGYEVG